MAFRIILEKENFKFSCSHFTVLSETSAERLHGHNYYLRLEIHAQDVSPTLGMAFDFNLVKPLVIDVVRSLDERVLLPANSPYVKVASANQAVAVDLGSKHYVFPEEDVRILPIANVTSEELARFIANELARKLKQALSLQAEHKPTRLSVTIEETRGQGVSYEISL